MSIRSQRTNHFRFIYTIIDKCSDFSIHSSPDIIHTSEVVCSSLLYQFHLLDNISFSISSLWLTHWMVFIWCCDTEWPMPNNSTIDRKLCNLFDFFVLRQQAERKKSYTDFVDTFCFVWDFIQFKYFIYF